MKAIQQFMLGTVLNNEKQARETLRCLKTAGYEGIELCSFMIHPTGLMVRMLTKAAGMPTGNGGKLDWPNLIRESGLAVVSLHYDLGSIERDPGAVAADAKLFGTDKIVITGMYRFPYGDAQAVRGLAVRLNKAGERLADSGIHLLYHNHNCEQQRVKNVSAVSEKIGKVAADSDSDRLQAMAKRDVSPASKRGNLRAWDILLEETDPNWVNFEFDSYWYTEGGGDAKAMMRRLGNRMKLWHINDRGTRLTGPAMTPILKTDSMELGCGNMDLAGLRKIALANGIEAVILESHRNWIDNSPLKSAQVSANYLNAKF